MRLPALTLEGNVHPTVAWIEEGTAGGWRTVVLRDGTVRFGVSTTELSNALGVDPFANVNAYDPSTAAEKALAGMATRNDPTPSSATTPPPTTEGEPVSAPTPPHGSMAEMARYNPVKPRVPTPYLPREESDEDHERAHAARATTPPPGYLKDLLRQRDDLANSILYVATLTMRDWFDDHPDVAELFTDGDRTIPTGSPDDDDDELYTIVGNLPITAFEYVPNGGPEQMYRITRESVAFYLNPKI